MRKEKKLPAISDLLRLSAPQLQAAHQEMFGAKHPIANCQYLRRKIAWHLQAAKEGGLPESVRQYAIAIARGAELRVRMSQIMELVWLAPDIQRAILEFPPRSATRFPISELAARRIAVRLDWVKQRDLWRKLKQNSHLD